MNEDFKGWNVGQFNDGQSQSAFFDDIGQGVGDWVEGWGKGNVVTADYNAAVVEQKRAAIEQQKQIVAAAVKIAGLFAIVICAVLLVKAFKK